MQTQLAILAFGRTRGSIYTRKLPLVIKTSFSPRVSTICPVRTCISSLYRPAQARKHACLFKLYQRGSVQGKTDYNAAYCGGYEKRAYCELGNKFLTFVNMRRASYELVRKLLLQRFGVVRSIVACFARGATSLGTVVKLEKKPSVIYSNKIDTGETTQLAQDPVVIIDFPTLRCWFSPE